MFDQLVIGNIGTDDNFGATVSSRAIKDPPKKKITKTVPFSNQTYDFSKINGELYWGQRELDYEFEMIASCYEELEEMKINFSNFIMNVFEDEIHDPFIPDYHFKGTFESKEYDDDESGLKTTVKVKFMAYPYKISNRQKKYTSPAPVLAPKIVTVHNTSGHRIIPTITIIGDVRIIYGNISYAASNETVHDELFSLNPGVNKYSIQGIGENGEPCSIEICFHEEVF